MKSAWRISKKGFRSIGGMGFRRVSFGKKYHGANAKNRCIFIAAGKPKSVPALSIGAKIRHSVFKRMDFKIHKHPWYPQTVENANKGLALKQKSPKIHAIAGATACVKMCAFYEKKAFGYDGRRKILW